MREITVHIVHAFVKDPRSQTGGNPAGVVLDADGLDSDARQRIAAKVGLSETAFVQPRPEGFRMIFHTPARQIPDCGHATVAAFALLAEQGLLTTTETSKELADGTILPIFLEGDRVFMRQQPPVFTGLSTEESRELLAVLGLEPERVAGPGPEIVSTGAPFIQLPLTDIATLAAIEPDFPRLRDISDHLDAVGCYLFHVDPDHPTTPRARMFAPAYGIDEESATGTAAGAMGACLALRMGISGDFRIEQGTLMNPPRPSELLVRAPEGGHVRGPWVGGLARIADVRAIRH